jgi:plasminogen activator inhibitor 1 RNA-binding protein
LDAEQSGAADATVDAGNEWGGAANNDWSAPAEGGAENKPAEGEEQGERPQKEEEEEDNTMTLTEYLAKKKASEAIPGRLQARAANEGADNNLWKDAVQVQRDEDEENYFIGKVRLYSIYARITAVIEPKSQTKSTPKARTKKEEKVHIDIEARFAPIERGRGRGDRGRGDRGRGDRSRGRGRGGDSGRGRRPEANLDVSDESAFPSLS